MELSKLTYNQLAKLHRVERKKYLSLPVSSPDLIQLAQNIRAIDAELRERAKQLQVSSADAYVEHWFFTQRLRKYFALFWIVVGGVALLYWVWSGLQ